MTAACLAAAPPLSADLELHPGPGDPEWAQTASLAGKTPVLFVPGHHLQGFNRGQRNYVNNWSSFMTALESNAHLGLEPYRIDFDEEYSRGFRDKSRLISVDAEEIGEAIQKIQERHAAADPRASRSRSRPRPAACRPTTGPAADWRSPAATT